MKRKDFIKTSLIAGAGISMLPSFTMDVFQESYTRDELIGKSNPNIVGESYTSKMHRETQTALSSMAVAATAENIKIEVVSAFRSFERQKQIYESKYERFTSQGLTPMEAIEKIIEYSTIPGTSRHHWGTDLDIIDANAPRPKNVLQPEHFHGKGPYCKLKEWLNEHASSFGFFEVYTDDPYRRGFKYEPWHFSLAAVSVPMLQAYKELDLKKILQEEKIKGSTYFTDDFITRYRKQNILDINPQLLA